MHLSGGMCSVVDKAGGRKGRRGTTASNRNASAATFFCFVQTALCRHTHTHSHFRHTASCYYHIAGDGLTHAERRVFLQKTKKCFRENLDDLHYETASVIDYRCGVCSSGVLCVEDDCLQKRQDGNSTWKQRRESERKRESERGERVGKRAKKTLKRSDGGRRSDSDRRKGREVVQRRMTSSWKDWGCSVPVGSPFLWQIHGITVRSKTTTEKSFSCAQLEEHKKITSLPITAFLARFLLSLCLRCIQYTYLTN